MTNPLKDNIKIWTIAVKPWQAKKHTPLHVFQEILLLNIRLVFLNPLPPLTSRYTAEGVKWLGSIRLGQVHSLGRLSGERCPSSLTTRQFYMHLPISHLKKKSHHSLIAVGLLLAILVSKQGPEHPCFPSCKGFRNSLE